jgi:N-dimethylarginine dimethylaminohydrolase
MSDTGVSRLLRQAQDIDFAVNSLPAVGRPDRVLMADPDFFQVDYVINTHMTGRLGTVNRRLALLEWDALRETYEALGIQVDVLPAAPLLPDLVFTANQCLSIPPGIVGEGPAIVPSIMRASRRRAEVSIVVDALASRGLDVLRLNRRTIDCFEGMGDAAWLPGRALLFGGVGPRSSWQAYETISTWTALPVALFELVDERFYHLDTCLSFLNETTALAYLPAFAPAGQGLLRALIPNLIEVPEAEAMAFVCNGHCPDGRTFITPPGAPKTFAALEAAGFDLAIRPTGEFLKSGGSVYCMKLHWWSSALSSIQGT